MEEKLQLGKKIIYSSEEVDDIFKLIYKEKLDDLVSYISNEQNEIWNIKRGDDITLLHSACVFDKSEIIEIIIKETKNRLKLNNENTLTNEEREKNKEIFNNFINAKTKADRLTALHYSSFRGNIKIIKLLIENNADINALTYNGLNMIHKAAQGNKPSGIIYFNKKYNMDLEVGENKENLNAMHLAAISGMDNSVIFLLSLGMNPNIQDNQGYTALHYAVKYNHIRIIKKLLQKGARKDIRENKYNKTPADMAKNNPEIDEIFREKSICEKLFLKPDISSNNFYLKKNMILSITLFIIIIILIFFVLFPFFNNTFFSISYLIISFIIFVLFLLLKYSNPGIMVNEQYTDLLDIVEKEEDAENFCPYCLIKHKYKSKHCLICKKCIEEFDHHCFWVGNCVGKNNYSLFFIFLIYVNLNVLLNIYITFFYLLNEIISPYKNKDNNSFPGFIFGINSFIYHKVNRLLVSIFICCIGIIFLIPLIKLFIKQLFIAFERRRHRIDEEEYEKNRLTEKLEEENENDENVIKVNLDEEIWGDIIYRKESTDIADKGK